MIYSDPHLNWLRSLESGDLVGISYYNCIQPGIIYKVLKETLRIWGYDSGKNEYRTVENLPRTLEWIPVHEGLYKIPREGCTIGTMQIYSRGYERLVPYPKDFISKKTLKNINLVKERLF